MIWDWGKDWKIPANALIDLAQRLGTLPLPMDPLPLPPDAGEHSEAWVETEVRLEASSLGHRLWRNNVGAYQPGSGGFVRYGLCNDTAKMNEKIKSADLIGIRKRVITLDMVKDGPLVIGQFYSRECKREGWKFRGDEHELAQQKWMDIVNSMGGDAAFVSQKGTLK